MKRAVNYIQKQYEGFLQTPNLWKGSSIASLEQFELNAHPHRIKLAKPELRLGKRVEQFVAFQLEKEGSSVIASNIQIKKEKETIGEIDFIIQKNNKPIHLEVCYKYYLFDPYFEGKEIEKWIGPNRRDSFKLKLEKLQNKQFPLLHNPATKFELSALKIATEKIEQKVLFKAQLYIPAAHEFQNNLPINELNIQGFYYRLTELDSFSDCKFFIPKKPDWLITPFPQINWLNYDNFKKDISTHLSQNSAPLCWLKKPSGAIEKLFVVWW